MDWRYNTIWFDQLEPNIIFEQDFKEKKSKGNFDTAEYAIIWHLKQGDTSFDNLLPSDKLLYLDLNWTNIKDFQGIKKFKSLKRLELHYCVKLESDNGLQDLSDTLEFLHINLSKKFKFTDNLVRLKKLKVLCLNSCGQIDNLNFLNSFPNLIDFRFVDTNVLDGNLKPLLEHPTLRTVGFLNKKHYNFTDKRIELELAKKSQEEYKKAIHKGQYKTFRYNYE